MSTAKNLANVARFSSRFLTCVNSRAFATEASPDDYGYTPDPLEAAHGNEKKMMLASLAGDDRYDPKMFYRLDKSTANEPNIVPCLTKHRILGCLCEEDSGYINFMVVRLGETKRCECGHWFRGIPVQDPDA